ncbi:MAG: LacI family transcriptional regulator [Spirochaetes bacterium]|nr:LacI family transcriptional regulator [Spirochaetota bacterium]
MAVTIHDIARIAGVNSSTVSRSLNDSPLISEKTKNRIKEIAKDHNFQFNSNAQRLRKNKTDKIGIILPYKFYQKRTTQFFDIVQKYFFEKVHQIGYSAIIESIRIEEKSARLNQIFSLANSKELDALIIADYYITAEEVEILKKSQIPHVFLYYQPKVADQLDNYFQCNNFLGGYLATEYLIKNGHKKIITITINDYKYEFEQRTAGYKKALNDYGLSINEDFIFKIDITFDSGKKFVTEHLKLFQSIDALFVQTDTPLLGMVQELERNSIVIPRDLSAVGYDNQEINQLFPLRISSVDQKIELLLHNAIQYLLTKINKTEIFIDKIIKPELAVYDSVRQRI